MFIVEFVLPVIAVFLFVKNVIGDAEYTCEKIKEAMSYETAAGEGFCFFEIPHEKVVNQIWYKDEDGDWLYNGSAAYSLCQDKFGARVLHLDPEGNRTVPGYKTFTKLIKNIKKKIPKPVKYLFPIDCATLKGHGPNCPLKAPPEDTHDYVFVLQDGDPYTRLSFTRGQNHFLDEHVTPSRVICQIDPDPSYTVANPSGEESTVGADTSVPSAPRADGSAASANQALLIAMLSCAYIFIPPIEV